MKTTFRLINFFALFLFFSSPNFGQGAKLRPDVLKYYKTRTKAWETLVVKKDSNLALQEFSQLLMYPKILCYKDLEQYIMMCLKLGKIEEAERWILFAISTYGVPIYSFCFEGKITGPYGEILKRDDWSGYCKIHKEIKRLNLGKYFITNYKEKEKICLNNFYSKVDMDDIIALEHFVQCDVYFRSHLQELYLTSNDSINNLVVENIYLQFDTIETLPFVNYLIKKNNFPSDQDLGFLGNSKFALLNLHQYLNLQLLDSALYNGKLSPEDYAGLYDKFYGRAYVLDEETNSITGRWKKNYGAFLICENINDSIPKYALGEIDDIENVDKRRAEIGLLPFWIYAKIEGIELSKEYLESCKKNRIIVK